MAFYKWWIQANVLFLEVYQLFSLRVLYRFRCVSTVNAHLELLGALKISTGSWDPSLQFLIQFVSPEPLPLRWCKTPPCMIKILGWGTEPCIEKYTRPGIALGVILHLEVSPSINENTQPLILSFSECWWLIACKSGPFLCPWLYLLPLQQEFTPVMEWRTLSHYHHFECLLKLWVGIDQ